MLNDIKQLVMSSRPISWVNTAFPFVAGYLVAEPKITPLLIIGGLYFLFPYNLLMYGINDVFDYESDIKNPRKGGIEGIQLQKHLHRITIIAAIAINVPFVLYLLMQGSIASKLVLLYSVFMVLAYSVPKLRFKERPIIDSLTSSTHFVSPLVYALVLTGWQSSYWPFVMAFFVWGMASHAFGAVQDIIADRSAGIASIATYFGARTTVWLSIIAYSLTGVLLAIQGGAGLVMAVLAWLYALSVARYMRITDKTCEAAHEGWRTFLWLNQLVGFVLTLLLILYLRHA